jgi:TrwC relaxase
MLTIGKLGAGQERYYLEKVADGAEDYYSGEGEAPGRWSGDGSRELGLEGDVGDDQLRAMLTGHDPATGEPLVATHGACRSQGPVPGFDLTFSAPTSASLLRIQYPSANLASSDIMSGDQGGSKTIFGWTFSTPSRSPTNSLICSVTWGPMGQAGVVRVNVMKTSESSTSTS